MIREWWASVLEKKQDYYQRELEKADKIATQRAKEVGYSYLRNMDEMEYLFDKIDYLRDQRNYYRSKAGKIRVKLKWEHI